MFRSLDEKLRRLKQRNIRKKLVSKQKLKLRKKRQREASRRSYERRKQKRQEAFVMGILAAERAKQVRGFKDYEPSELFKAEVGSFSIFRLGVGEK